ncbi:MAG: helix-turn-helix domain-containing protein [Ruminococcaceae bacterium]|nr:helix-turn-helix domain-containing protein [Oscillospiraceae bacterium]
MNIWNCKQDINIQYLRRTDVSLSPKRHSHPLEELLIVEQGRAVIGNEDRIIQLDGSFAVIHPRETAHYQANDVSDGYRRWYLHFDSQILSDLMVNDPLPLQFSAVKLTQEQLAVLQQFLHPLLQLRFRNIEPEDVHARKLLLALILNTLMPIIRESQGDAHPSAAGSSTVGEICNYINKHYDEPLTLESIANQFYISRSKLSRSFRSTLNVSVKTYIQTLRIDKAKKLLARGFSIEEVTGKCGFGDSRYFIKVFHRIAGITPAKYRKMAEPED